MKKLLAKSAVKLLLIGESIDKAIEIASQSGYGVAVVYDGKKIRPCYKKEIVIYANKKSVVTKVS